MYDPLREHIDSLVKQQDAEREFVQSLRQYRVDAPIKGQYVSDAKPSLEMAARVLDDAQFRRALHQCVLSYLAGPCEHKEKQHVNLTGFPEVVLPSNTTANTTIRFQLCYLDGERQWCTIPSTMTFGTFKDRLSNLIEISSAQLRFVFQGSPVSDGQTFAQGKMINGDMLHVILQITGS
jgi:hypothetical protein